MWVLFLFFFQGEIQVVCGACVCVYNCVLD